MKKQLEDGIKLIGEMIAATPFDSDKTGKLLSLLGTLQGLLILETLKP